MLFQLPSYFYIISYFYCFAILFLNLAIFGLSCYSPVSGDFMAWYGHLQPAEIIDVRTRRHFWYEINGTNINMSDELVIPLGQKGLPVVCTLTYLAMSCNGVVKLNPILKRIEGAESWSIDTEINNGGGAATKIHNQQPACLILPKKQLVIKPNADTDNISIRISLCLVEGHDSRGT